MLAEVSMRVLVVDDDVRLCSVIARGLEEEGYAVDVAHDGEEGQYMAEIHDYDLVILDIMMPKVDGISVCRHLREGGRESAILMLTAKDAVADRVQGLDAGADDYLPKPFAFDELSARVRALTRRGAPNRLPQLSIGDLTLDTVTRRVRRCDEDIDLTAKEYAVLEYFMRNPGAVITRGMVEEHAWNNDFDSVSNLVDVYIRRLRSKIDRPGEKSFVETLRGAGYRLRIP
jgi:DNA-binding response OmpR family regulator